MAPKAKPSKTAVAKAKQKLEDKTFGMKNKKGSKNQKFIATEQKAAGMDKGAKARAEAKRIEDRRNKIEEEKRLKRQQELLKAKIQKAKEAAALNSGNPVPAAPAPEPEEPRRVTGASMTLTVGATELTPEQQAKLARKNAPKKEKVVEVVISLEELIEKERAALSKKGNLTPVNVETFAAWKAKVKKIKLAAEKKQMQDKKILNKKTGKEYFSQNPNIAMKDADEEEEEEVDCRIEVRGKRMTDEDKDTRVFGEGQDGDLPSVDGLKISTPTADTTGADAAAPVGAKADVAAE